MSDGTLQTLDVTMLDDVGTGANQLIQLDANAKIPACSGASITNLPGVTKSASDPVITTNPAGGLGSVWQNTTSGEMYICIDATAGDNVWTNIGAGTGDIKPYHGSGENYGYISGGAPGPYTNIIQKYSYTSATDSVDVANLTRSVGFNMGHSSATYGYVSGGGNPTSNVIDKHQFGTTNNSTDVGDLLHGTVTDSYGASSPTHGFVAGGYRGANVNEITAFSFSADGNSVDHGDLSAARAYGASSNSSTHGYYAAGAALLDIDKYAFASNVTAVDIGNVTVVHSYTDGTSSSTSGYIFGGANNVIDKYSFVSDGNSTDIGDLSQVSAMGSATSQTDYGYKAGGAGPDAQRIEKFSFASDGNSVDTTASTLDTKSYNAGTQY